MQYLGSEFQSYEESLINLKKHILPYERVEKLALTQVLGRILATDIFAKDDFPKYKTASMDGYAFIYDDLQNDKFEILGDLPAGKNIDCELQKGQCIKVFTGSILPKNADTVIPIELVKISENKIHIQKNVNLGFAVRQIGESYKKNELLLKKGDRLNFASIALLAELGYFHISVLIPPKIGILTTGSELKDIGENLENKAQIHSSNHIALAMLCKQMGLETVIFPIVKDDFESVKAAVLSAIKSCDILLTTGGVSVGDYDFMRDFLRSDFNLIVDKVAIKPGRHIKIAKSGEKFIIALPGFPISAITMSILYLSFIINEMLNIKDKNEFEAILKDDYVKKSPFLEITPATLSFENGQIFVSAKDKKQGSSAILNNILNGVLMIVPLEKNSLKSGDIVKVIKI